MKKILLVLFSLFWCFALVAQQNQLRTDADPDIGSIPNSVDTPGNILFGWDVEAITGETGNLGVHYAFGYLWVTARGLVVPTNQLWKMDVSTGTPVFVASYPQGNTDAWGWRDLCDDGTFLYASYSAVIEQIDPVTGLTTGVTIPSPVTPGRALAYDPATDHFWTISFTGNLFEIDRAGVIINSFPNPASTYGAGWDPWSPGGPFLWLNGGSVTTLVQVDPLTGVPTGVNYVVPAGIVGGLDTDVDLVPGKIVGIALSQITPDSVYVVELGDTGPPCPVGQATNPNPVNGATGVDINLAAISWTNGTGTAPTQIEVRFDGAVVYTGHSVTSYTIPGPLAYSTNYNWQVNGSDGICWNNGPIWTFTTMDDPSITGTWSSGSIFPDGTYLGSGVGANGYLYSIGGNTNSGLSTECYEYDVTMDSWAPIASLPVGKVVHSTANVGNYIFAFGGSSPTTLAYNDTVYKYDIIGDSWTQVSPLPLAFAWSKAVGYGNYIYIAGGHDGTNYLSNVYIYDTVADTFGTASPMLGARIGGAFSVTGNKLVYIGGADPVSSVVDEVMVGTIDALNPGMITWVVAVNKYPGIGKETISKYNVDPTDLMRGEKDKNRIPQETAYPPGTMYRFDAAPWGTEGIIVANGSPTSAWAPANPNPCYVYNPGTDTWTKQADVPIPVLGASLGSVNSGTTWNLVVASGYTGSVVTDATQIYTDDLGGGTTFAYQVTVADGWNMVSVPGTNPAGMAPVDWWSNLVGSVYKFSGGYVAVTTTAPTEGYWMKNNGAETYSYPATGIVAHNSINAAAGWNLIGGYELTVLTALLTTTPPGLLQLPIYEYSGGYIVATSIVPGYGYWAKMSAAGLIDAPPLAKGSVDVVEYFKEDWGKIILTDAAGTSYTLYAVNGEVDLNNYELPPAPPAGMFDIRFSSGRIAEDINSSMQTIDMSGVTYPLTVRVEGMDIRLQDETGRTVNVNLKSGEDVVISDATILKLMVTGELVPAVYALEQNYPNPFNPSTTIEFSLPEDVSNVKLSIYNALGERVAEIVNTSLVAGKYQYQWNAKNVATGMYIYELRTDKFVSVKKMILMK